jgi:hypothetical protein
MGEAIEIKDLDREIYPLNAEIKIRKTSDDFWHIRVGNTGLKFLVQRQSEGQKDKYVWKQHYLPDGQVSTSKNQRYKYSSVYAYALSHFLDWWENEENFSHGFPKEDIVHGISNSKMHEFRRNLFDAHRETIYEETAKYSYGRYGYSLHLDRLASNEEIRTRLSKLSKRCKKQKYRMKEPA